EKARNSAVTRAQTVWLPMSSGPVSQQPLRLKPVKGSYEQASSGPPRTLSARGSLMGSPFGGRRPPRVLPAIVDALYTASENGLWPLGSSGFLCLISSCCKVNQASGTRVAPVDVSADATSAIIEQITPSISPCAAFGRLFFWPGAAGAISRR